MSSCGPLLHCSSGHHSNVVMVTMATRLKVVFFLNGMMLSRDVCISTYMIIKSCLWKYVMRNMYVQQRNIVIRCGIYASAKVVMNVAGPYGDVENMFKVCTGVC